MKRREFLIGSATAVASGRAQGQRPDQAKLNRIAVMSLCFDSVLKSAASPDDPKRTLDILDLADMVAEHYGIHQVEYQHSHFPSTEIGYLQEFRSRLKKVNSQINQINLGFGDLNISSPNPVVRLETIDLTKRWIDHAVVLGCPRVMVNQGTLAPEVRQSAIETLKTIDAYAKAKKVFVTMENRNAPWEVVVEVIKTSGIWANPDSNGNFPDTKSQAAGLAVLYRLTAGSSHIKHNPDRFSTADCIKLSKEVGYKGLYSIEASRNNGPTPYAAVQTILDVLLSNI